VLSRGIIFIDLAVAQVAGLGALAAHLAEYGDNPWIVQGAAVGAALAAALLLQWSEKRWPQLQEALIGLLFVLAASGAVLLLSRDAHSGEHLRDLLVGQMLWVSQGQLLAAAAVSAALLLAWKVLGRQGGGLAFTLFVAVTVSLQLVGVYLVFQPDRARAGHPRLAAAAPCSRLCHRCSGLRRRAFPGGAGGHAGRRRQRLDAGNGGPGFRPPPFRRCAAPAYMLKVMSGLLFREAGPDPGYP
jgi:hypothetical protein